MARWLKSPHHLRRKSLEIDSPHNPHGFKSKSKSNNLNNSNNSSGDGGTSHHHLESFLGHSGKLAQRLTSKAKKLAKRTYFHALVNGCIGIAGVGIGLSTDKIGDPLILWGLDLACLVVFTFEMIVKVVTRSSFLFCFVFDVLQPLSSQIIAIFVVSLLTVHFFSVLFFRWLQKSGLCKDILSIHGIDSTL
jgi:hypothetical protein